MKSDYFLSNLSFSFLLSLANIGLWKLPHFSLFDQPSLTIKKVADTWCDEEIEISSSLRGATKISAFLRHFIMQRRDLVLFITLSCDKEIWISSSHLASTDYFNGERRLAKQRKKKEVIGDGWWSERGEKKPKYKGIKWLIFKI